MQLMAIGIRWRLVALIVLMIVPIAALIFLNARSERARRIEEAHTQIQGQALLIASAHNQLLLTVEELLTELQRDPALVSFSAPACDALARRLTAAHPAYSNIAVSNLDGIVECSANPAGEGSLVADRPYYQQALATGDLTTSGYLFGRISQKPVDVFAVPLLGPADEPLGVIELSIDLQWLSNLIQAQQFGDEVRTTVLGPDGMVLVRVPEDMLVAGAIANPDWVQQVLSAAPMQQADFREADGSEAIGAMVPLDPLSNTIPGYVMVTTSRTTALAAAEGAFQRGVLAIAGIGVVGAIWAWTVSTIGVHRPVRALLHATREYARGAFETRVGVSRLSSGEITELAGAFESMADEVARNHAILQRNATRDRLTDLPNRIEFSRLMNLRLQDASDQPQALMVVRLHEFSSVNATFGFEGGDALLLQVAPRITAVFGPMALVARIEGDEFAVFVPGDETSGPSCEQLLADAFDAPFDLQGEQVYLPIRAGIARYPRDGGEAVALTRRATLALRRAEQGPRDVTEYDAERDEPRSDQIKLLSALRAAVEAGQLELHYQPKVDLQRGEVHGAEALMRWRREDGSSVPPGEFIVLAEQSGYIRTLTSWAMDEAARQIREWHDAGLVMQIALNVSGADFEDERLAERLGDLRQRWGLADGAIEIEITESSMVTDTARAAAHCEAMRAHGYTIAIDDFGTGYSPLVYLQRLPITSIKIDQTFVRDMTTNQRSRDIVEHTLSLGRRLGIVTIAEGIETQDVAESLRALGCDVGQGYYFGRPMPAAEFAAWVRDNPLGFAARQVPA